MARSMIPDRSPRIQWGFGPGSWNAPRDHRGIGHQSWRLSGPVCLLPGTDKLAVRAGGGTQLEFRVQPRRTRAGYEHEQLAADPAGGDAPASVTRPARLNRPPDLTRPARP